MAIFNIINFENFNLNLQGIFSWFKRENLSKVNASILFIDDEEFPVVENLQKAGWSVKKIKDVKNIQDQDIQRAHIIFVDYKGVGKTLSQTEEGIGLIRAIKEAYRNKKRVVLYSGQSRFSLGPHLEVADAQLSKDSDTYQFISLIERELKQIK